MVIRDDQVLVTFRNRVLKFEVFLADHNYILYMSNSESNVFTEIDIDE